MGILDGLDQKILLCMMEYSWIFQFLNCMLLDDTLYSCNTNYEVINFPTCTY